MLASPSSLQSDLREAQNNVRAKKFGTRRRYLQTAAFAGFFSLIAMGVCSCGSPKPIHFFQLNPPALAPTSTAEPYPTTILIGVINTSALYAQDRIVYGTESEGMGLYLYERWAEPPNQMIQELLLRELREGKRFTGVYSGRSGVRGDYVLRGRLYDFKEVSGSSSVVARVSLDLELRNVKTASTVWSYSYRQDEPVTGDTAAAVVAALDKNIARGAREASAGIAQYFADHPPQPAVAAAVQN